jgi:hypothetical protein
MCRGADARGGLRRCSESRPWHTSTGLVRPWWCLNHDRGRVPPMRHRNLAGSRDSGLRRLSRLTFRASLLSMVAAFGMATLFAKTAHSEVSTANTSPAGHQGASTGPSPSASGKPAKASPSASARAVRRAAHHRARTVAPAAGQSSQPAPAPAQSSAAAPKPTIAPPTHAPSPAPSKTPAPAPSSTSHPA